MTLPLAPVLLPEQAALMKGELMLKEAMTPVPDSQGGFYSNLFLAPRKNG